MRRQLLGEASNMWADVKLTLVCVMSSKPADFRRFIFKHLALASALCQNWENLSGREGSVLILFLKSFTVFVFTVFLFSLFQNFKALEVINFWRMPWWWCIWYLWLWPLVFWLSEGVSMSWVGGQTGQCVLVSRSISSWVCLKIKIRSWRRRRYCKVGSLRCCSLSS